MTPPWRYRLLVRLLSPLLVAYTAWRATRDGGRRYWWQRLGVYGSLSEPDGACARARARADAGASKDANDGAKNGLHARERLWVHAASVGEVVTVMPLVKAWLACHPDERILMTTGTPTGAAIVEKQSPAGVHHQYLPIDFPGACKRFIRQLAPCKAWIVETEIWPWLYACCRAQGIHISIINGRLSQRTSQQSNSLLGSSYRQALQGIDVLARSSADVKRFIELGAETNRVRLAGNLKLAGLAEASSEHRALIARNYVLAASTHADEELQLAQSWLKCLENRQHLLVIVPRHPERGPAIQRQIQTAGITALLRSRGEQPQSHDRIYIADTLGELQAWYQYAQATFVGGSLITRGGHNMLEPARYACPIVVGPHTENFLDIMQLMLEADAIRVVNDADQAIAFLLDAAAGDADFSKMGARARLVAENSQAVLERYIAALS